MASVFDHDLLGARNLAGQIGIRHQVIETDEFANQDYTRNAPDRCYHCKTELYSRLEKLAPELDVEVLFNGANLDDLGDYRPGMTAASEHAVRSPLIETGLDITPIITHQIQHGEFEKGFELMISGKSGKVVMDWET